MRASAIFVATVAGVIAMLGAHSAHADVRLAAIAQADDARQSLVLGAGGEVYEPDGSGAWQRRQAGGTGDDLTTAVRASGGDVIAGAAEASASKGPPFRLHAGTGTWEMVPIALRAHAVVSRGTRAIAAAGKLVFALDSSSPAKLPDAAFAPTMIGATSAGVSIATGSGVFRLDGTRWRVVEGGPSGVVGLASERWAILVGDDGAHPRGAGAYDLRGNTYIAWPQGFAPTAFAADAAGDLVAAAASAGALDVVTIRDGKLARESVATTVVTPAAGEPPVAAAIDHRGNLVIALRDGRLAVRDGTTWRAAALHDALPAAHPGAPPAATR